MTDLYFKLASAIATQEGFFVNGSLPQRMNNPGDLRSAPWLQNPVVEHGFWHARSVAEGLGGLYHQIALDVSRGWTLKQLIYSWAPPSDNNKTDAYLAAVAAKVGVDPGKPLWSYLEVQKI